MESGYTQRIKIQGETFHLNPVAIEVENLGGFKPGRVPTLKKQVMIRNLKRISVWICGGLLENGVLSS